MDSTLRWIITPLMVFLFTYISAQDTDILRKSIQLRFPENSIQGHVDNLALHEGIILSFNSSRVDVKKVVYLPVEKAEVEIIIKRLFEGQEVGLSSIGNKVLIQFLEDSPSEFITIKGYVKDSKSGEALVGATVVDANTNHATFTNEMGFYSITTKTQDVNIQCTYLGYDEKVLDTITSSTVNFNMEFANEMTTVLIKASPSDDFRIGSGGKKVDITDTKGFASISGENDILFNIRTNPGVQSGNEGQSGLYVRGGSPDQNLVLLDGIPLYEVSHTAGFSSMFIEESIKNAEFIKNGFPARFTGRSSSVLNIQLKDGDVSSYNGKVQFSLPGVVAHLDGPLFNRKTTFNISGRKSYLGEYLNSAVGKITNYDDIGVDYFDFVGKVTHRFSNNTKLSFSYYNGGDELSLLRTTNQSSSTSIFETANTDALEWGSKVWNVNLHNILSDKLIMNLNLGGVGYRYYSRGSYTFKSIEDNLVSNQALDVVSFSNIDDNVFSINLDYYHNDLHRLKFGAGYLRHDYNPAVRQNREIKDGVIDSLVIANNNILADEYYMYVEDTYVPQKNWQIYAGVNLSGFSTAGVSYQDFQPRLSIIYEPSVSDRIALSYTHMAQYVHSLVNAGIGLPSELWVPSTSEIAPERSRQISISYARKLPLGFDINIDAYYKYQNNLIEYLTPVDLFFTVLNTNQPPVIQDDPDWITRVRNGSGSSKGLEFYLKKKSGKWSGWCSYALAKTTRNFPELNDGKVFPYRFDRRHDLNIGLKHTFSNNIDFAINYVFGTGNAFSLALEGYDSVFGIELVNSDKRNNYRYPAFHHLDMQFNFHKTYKSGSKFFFNLGLYNVYNRKNAYYIYIVNSPLSSKPVARKTSILPVLPNLSVGYEF